MPWILYICMYIFTFNNDKEIAKYLYNNYCKLSLKKNLSGNLIKTNKKKSFTSELEIFSALLMSYINVNCDFLFVMRFMLIISCKK